MKALTRLREQHENMTVLQAMCLLFIAENPGATAHQIFEALGTSDSVVSRNLALLCDVGVRNSSPLGLVEMKINPADRREKLLTLTSAGRKLMNQGLTELARGE